MAARPTWSGFIQISLVSIGVRIYPASATGRPIEFHQIDRKTHRRIHHQNVDEGGEVDRSEIVKGFEYARGKYIEIDPDELKSLRIATATTMQIQQFVTAAELPTELFERPYYVAPKDKAQAKALAIMTRAMSETETFGIGELAFSGREHLGAIGAPHSPKQKGLMLYLLRYEEDLRDPPSAATESQRESISTQELALARQLIQGSTSKFDLSAYKDDYEAAVRKLVDAKRKGKPLPEAEPEPARSNVVDIMEALKKSLHVAKGSARKRSRSKKAA
ncbi:MAG TPA: Ku protein [Acidobacteriaceae bacterium]|jgi:DNA end-binding protein Ku|nr:Ku protein [Acidobacteriaceae bacterium]